MDLVPICHRDPEKFIVSQGSYDLMSFTSERQELAVTQQYVSLQEHWTYDTMISTVDTGDLVYFMCKSWTAALTCCTTCTYISHVAVVLRVQMACAGVPPGIYLAEAVYHEDGVYDYLSKTTGQTGVRLVDIHEKMHMSRYEFFEIRVHQLERIDTKHRPRMAQNAVLALQQTHIGYDANLWNIVRSFLDFVGMERGHENPKKYFCSQLVAHMWMDMGIISRDTNCAEVTPSDFFYGTVELEWGQLGAVVHELDLETIRSFSKTKSVGYTSRK